MLESSISPTSDFRLRLQTARAHSMTYIFRQICTLLYEFLKTLVGLFEQKETNVYEDTNARFIWCDEKDM